MVLVIGVVFSCFNNWTVFIPVIFPRIAIAIRPLFNKKNKAEVAISQEDSIETEIAEENNGEIISNNETNEGDKE